MYEIVAFHVSHRKNRESIEWHGILSRAEIQRRDIEFVDIANNELITKIQKRRVFDFLDPIGGTIRTIDIKKIELDLSDYVPFYFIRPVHRPEIVPPAVYYWQKEYQDLLDYWVLDPNFLFSSLPRARPPKLNSPGSSFRRIGPPNPPWYVNFPLSEYVICIGHWGSTQYGRPLLLDDLRIFLDLITNIPNSLENQKYIQILNDNQELKKTFREDIPNILEGNVVIEYLESGKYRYLMGSSIFIERRVPRHHLIRLSSTEEMRELPSDWKIII